MKKHVFLTMIVLFIAGIIGTVAAQEKTITVSGTVLDSVTGAPVTQAMILLYASETINIDPNATTGLKLDTAFTGVDGKFTHTMKVSQKSILLVYGILKQGYQLKYSLAAILLTTVNCGVIPLSPAGDLTMDTIVVSGTVADSQTGAGIPGALVVLSGLGSFDTTGSTVLTGNDGTFSKQVIIGNTAANRALVGVVSKDGYRSGMVQKTVTGKQMNLGTILLKKNSTAVLPRSTAPQRPRAATAMLVHTLDGRLLYSGPVKPVGKVTNARNKAVIVSFDNSDLIVDAKKAALVH